MNVINEKTLLPISLIMVFMGGVVWLTTINAKVNSHQTAIQRIEADNRISIEILHNIDKRLLEIETTLKIKAGQK